MRFILINTNTHLYYVHETNSWQAEIRLATVFNIDQVHEAIGQFQMFDEFDVYPIYCHWLARDENTNPRCTCGETDNLTECRAIPDSTYHLCARCKREESEA